MWPLTKKILAAAVFATVLGAAVGLATGFLLEPIGEAFTGLTGLETTALTTFPMSNVAIFFGVSGGLMAAATTTIEALKNPASPNASTPSVNQAKDAASERSPAIEAPAIHHGPSTPSVATPPSSRIDAVQHGGALIEPAISAMIQ